MNTYIITFKFLLEDSDSIPIFVVFMLTLFQLEKQKKNNALGNRQSCKRILVKIVNKKEKKTSRRCHIPKQGNFKYFVINLVF